MLDLIHIVDTPGLQPSALQVEQSVVMSEQREDDSTTRGTRLMGVEDLDFNSVG